MLHSVLVYVHILGLTLMGGGLLGVFVADLRSRQATELPAFAETVRIIALCYDGLVVPGAILLGASGTWLIIAFHGGWAFLEVPWLAGMVGLFLFEFIEGNTVTRLYFMALKREARRSMDRGAPTTELAALRDRTTPTFTHFLDLPMLFLIISLGMLRPDDWTLFLIGSAIAVAVAAVLTRLLHGLHRSGPSLERRNGPPASQHGLVPGDGQGL